MIVFKNSKSVFYGQWTILLVTICFGFFKFHQKLYLRCSDRGVKLFAHKNMITQCFFKFPKIIFMYMKLYLYRLHVFEISKSTGNWTYGVPMITLK